MRKPETIERLYLDFDGFFASVEQQAHPHLRGRPVGVVPFDSTLHTCVIACSKEAKAAGVRNVMNVTAAQKICPDIILTPQSPDLYRRAHNALLCEISAVIPVRAVKSIDELCCDLEPRDIAAPQALAQAIKTRIKTHIGAYITCSIGFAANRQLAKIAGKQDKPDGVTIWHPGDMPGPLLKLPFADIPGIGRAMEKRLYRAGIFDMKALLDTAPKQMRKLWRNVTGERLWYALHGFAVEAGRSERGMYGHGRVLPPSHRKAEHAIAFSRLLVVKAARRMRRGGFYAGRLWLGLSLREGRWFGQLPLPFVQDDAAILEALMQLWGKACDEIPLSARIIRLHVTLLELVPAQMRQLDLLLDDDPLRRRWEAVTCAIDRLNRKYGRTAVSLGPWVPPPGGNAGGKISYTRIPGAEDFW
ncbi:MAG TPA: type VI secretion protein ImpB [Rhizobiales bacterium]|nr:type VI secretion protein ImpB [Hyphomicrobiales bacterium]